MSINTHGFEEEENEHDVVDKVYLNIGPRRVHTSLAKKLKQQAGEKYKCKCVDSIEWKSANHILDLEDENAFLKKLIRQYHIENDAFTEKGSIKCL